jgi:transposase
VRVGVEPAIRTTLGIPVDLELLSRDELIERISALEALVLAQQREIEEHRRAPKRQAAPFSRGKKDGQKKRPGRKPGRGPFDFRRPPPPEQVTENIDVPPPDTCPECGASELIFDRFEEAYTIDIPERPTPEVTRFRSATCHCGRCGKSGIRGRHPRLPPDQRGATACGVGPRAYAAAHSIHYGFGTPVQKTPAIIKELAGVELTQSAITQHALRQAERPTLCAAYDKLRDAVRTSSVAQSDDTGYRVNGESAQLMVFATPDTEKGPGITVYPIRPQHRNEEVREVIPGDYQGTLVTDRGRSYDAKELNAVKQQKCIFHVGRSIDAVLETKVGAAREFGKHLLDLLDKALEHWHGWHEGKRRGWHKEAARIAAAITHALRPRKLTDAANQRLLNELGYHDDRGNLTRFLTDPNIPATNNLSERELRLPIQARKVSHCSKNDRGARAAERHSTIIRTVQRRRPASLIAEVQPILCAPNQQGRPA